MTTNKKGNRIGYRLLYDAKGCSISGHNELLTGLVVAGKYDVQIYFGPKPQHGIHIVSGYSKYYVPGTKASFGKQEFKTEINGSSGHGPFFLEIAVSVQAETTVSPESDTDDLLLKQAESRRDEFKGVIHLVAGIIGLRFHRQFVLEPFNEDALAWSNDIPTKGCPSPILECLELICLNDNGMNQLEALKKPFASLSLDTLKKYSLIFHWLLRAWHERDNLHTFIALFIPLETLLTTVTDTKMSTEDKHRAKSVRMLLRKHAGSQSEDLLSFIDKIIGRTGPTLDERFEDLAKTAKLPGWEADIEAFGKFKRMRNMLIHGSDKDVQQRLSVGLEEVRTLQDLVERYVNYVLFQDNNVYRSRWRPEIREKKTMNNKCLHIALNEVKKDPALAPTSRGARKFIVTEILTNKGEEETKSDIWKAPQSEKPCPVLWISNVEMAVFNEVSSQDRHYHKEGTEVYMVIEGQMTIEVESKTYKLLQGDTLIVHPFSVHEVKSEGTQFLCRVITLNCQGKQDKFVI